MLLERYKHMKLKSTHEFLQDGSFKEISNFEEYPTVPYFGTNILQNELSHSVFILVNDIFCKCRTQV